MHQHSHWQCYFRHKKEKKITKNNATLVAAKVKNLYKIATINFHLWQFTVAQNDKKKLLLFLTKGDKKNY